MTYSQNVLALCGLAIVALFLALLILKKATPFTALVLSPTLVAIFMGYGFRIGAWSLQGIMGGFKIKPVAEGVSEVTVAGTAQTATMLTFAILYFGLMISAGLFDPLVRFVLKTVKGDPLKVMVGTALLALGVSVDGDGSTTTIIVCTAMIPVFHKLGMKMMDLAVMIILANSVMNLLPWGGPTARIIAALGLDEGELLRKLIPGMAIACVWVVVVAFLRGRAERARLGIVDIEHEQIDAVSAAEGGENVELRRPKLIFVNLTLTLLLMFFLIFGGELAWVPKFNGAVLFMIAFAIALIINYGAALKLQRMIVQEYGPSVLQVIIMVLAAGVFMGILNGAGMSQAMGLWLADVIPASLGSHWAMVTAVISIPGAFLLSNDAFYLGVLPVLAQAGNAYGFTNLEVGLASTAGQAFHLLSPLVGFIYLLLNLTGVDMAEWQRTTAKWAIGSFIAFLIGMFVFAGVQF